MAASLEKSHVVQHAQCVVDNTGATIVHGFLVKDLDPTLGDPFGQALNVTGMPQRGDGLLGWSGLSAQRFNPVPFANSPKKIWVMVTWRPIEYQPMGQASGEWKATTRVASRAYDGDGRLVQLEHKDFETGAIHKAKTIKITDTVSCGIFTADWSTLENPTAALAPYMNAINTAPFRGCSKYTWWFSDLWIRKSNYQNEYNVHAEIQYDPEGWLQTHYYRDQHGEVWRGIEPALARDKGPGIYKGGGPGSSTKGYGFVRGTLKRGKSFQEIPSLIPQFDQVVPDLAPTKLFELTAPSGETPHYGVAGQ